MVLGQRGPLISVWGVIIVRTIQGMYGTEARRRAGGGKRTHDHASRISCE